MLFDIKDTETIYVLIYYNSWEWLLLNLMKTDTSESLKSLKGSGGLLYFLINRAASIISLVIISSWSMIIIYLFSMHLLLLRKVLSLFKTRALIIVSLLAIAKKTLFHWLHSEGGIFNFLLFIKYVRILVIVCNTVQAEDEGIVTFFNKKWNLCKKTCMHIRF